MKIKGAVTVKAPQEQVWRIFMDPTQFCSDARSFAAFRGTGRGLVILSAAKDR